MSDTKIIDKNIKVTRLSDYHMDKYHITIFHPPIYTRRFLGIPVWPGRKGKINHYRGTLDIWYNYPSGTYCGFYMCHFLTGIIRRHR